MREYKKSACVFCRKLNFIAAQGLCRACYTRQKRTGSLDYKRVRTKCKMEGCEKFVVSHGYCDMHWTRVKTHGDPNVVNRPADWGLREKHPLYQSWCWARERSGFGCVAEWEDFWAFVKDIGERPSANHKIKRLDESLPFGPTNVAWYGPQISGKWGATYAREHRKQNPDYWKDADLRKKYGIGIADYQRMHDEQEGLCAICGKSETVMDKKMNRVRMLAVDHCHDQGHVRKLLCQGCNQGLGNFKDDPELLEAAAKYLRSHL